jgi:peptidoglycan LD-endopeptidase LytH
MKSGIKNILLVLIAGLGLISCQPPPRQDYNEHRPILQDSPAKSANQKIVNSTPTPFMTGRNSNELQSPTPAPNNLANSVNTLPQLTIPENPGAGYEPVVIGKLIIPVTGVKREDLRDTFNDARSEGRLHDAIDIMAPEGTPVLAAADGQIARFFESERGGITIYQFNTDHKLIFYYAHLKSRAETLSEKALVKQGEVIGYVGDTGNAGKGNFHLHFAIWSVNDPKRFWEGTNINPYPLLH